VLGRLFERLPTEPDLAAGARELILRWAGEDPGGQIELLLTWWAKNREALLQSAEPDGNNGEDERD